MAEIPYGAALNRAMAEEMGRDERVVVLGEDVRAGFFGATSGLVQVYGPDRVSTHPSGNRGSRGWRWAWPSRD